MIEVDVRLAEGVARVPEGLVRRDRHRRELHVDAGMGLDELQHLDVVVQDGVDAPGGQVGELDVTGREELQLLQVLARLHDRLVEGAAIRPDDLAGEVLPLQDPLRVALLDGYGGAVPVGGAREVDDLQPSLVLVDVVDDHVDALGLQRGDERVERHDLVGHLRDPEAPRRFPEDVDVEALVLLRLLVLVRPGEVGNDPEDDPILHDALVGAVAAGEAHAGDASVLAVLVRSREAHPGPAHQEPRDHEGHHDSTSWPVHHPPPCLTDEAVSAWARRSARHTRASPPLTGGEHDGSGGVACQGPHRPIESHRRRA